MQIDLKKIAPYLLLAYSFLLCFIIAGLPIDNELLGDFTLEIFPRLLCGITLLLAGGIFLFEEKYNSWFSKEWGLLNIFIVLSFGMIFTLFHHSSVGLNSLIGDAYFNTAMITKYKYFNSLTDFNYLGLSSSYPALYHYTIGKLAAITGTEALKATHFEYYLAYCVLSIPLFLLLKRAVHSIVAIAFIFFIFLNFPVNNFFKPYEFISSIFFITWWLVFIETKHFSLKKILIGGLVGAAIFATYYYWFFIAAVYLSFSFLWEISQTGISSFWRNRKQTIYTLTAAAALSSFYWLPLFFDFMKYGVDSLQNMWLTEEMLQFSFLESKPLFVQLISGAGLVFLFLFRQNKVMEILLKLLAAIVFWYTLGYLMFYFKKPLVADKLHYLIYAICALAFFQAVFFCIKWNETFIKRIPLLTFSLLIFFGCNNFIAIKAHPFYNTMKNSNFPKYQTDKNEILRYKNKVMLCDRQYINAFIPVHYFININAHFSHPASRFRERLQFLTDLQQIQNPEVLAWFFTYNKFNQIDLLYFTQNPSFTIHDDNFPHGLQAVDITFTPALLQSQYIEFFSSLASEAGVIYELKHPPFELKKTFNSFELELANKYAQ